MSETVTNLYGGSPLNRLSWLRQSQAFLNRVIVLPETRFLLFNNGQPLSVTSKDSPKPSLFVNTNDIKVLLGPEPYFGQGQNPGEPCTGDDDDSDEHSGRHSPTKACRHLHARIVFLGIDEGQAGGNGAPYSALPLAEFKDPDVAFQKLKGTPYFAMDVAELGYSEDELRSIFESSLSKDGRTFTWAEPRSLMTSLGHFEAAVFASARSLVDWNFRNKFCPGCGSPTYSMWGGWKVACSTLLPWADNKGKSACPSGKGLQNYTHPRTDAVVIMIAIDETGDKVLLGRGRRFPGKFYSALAGFIEPGESFEDAVQREMWEEAGVRVWNVRYHSGQPWPYPANLMVGFYARADSSKPIRVDLDNELADARWFTKDEVRAVLNHRTGTTFGKSDYKRMNEIVEGKKLEDRSASDSSNAAARAFTPSEDGKAAANGQQPPKDSEPPFRLPPSSAIAGVLIRDWVEGKIGFFDQQPSARSPNL
ncbi:NAD+ diphosphatase [Coprinopsis cinerea okayama7|uniref:NAD(+) diphosphatase n=1 Tax=Coprinopsis cinerea (strain Okayama-7 / 130 / ATCC MYA-4618 / FGSC 9003) TaxID=240176 RepID=A8N707_COPC7|nr:NAD+ diphosphatase [Coprinopsis cinerea okayama7\|eukprot:XP_001830613.1 NAD+ diphosphatase [Coprinopsis cinerea okayama7\